MHYKCYGQGSQVIVFIHGFGGCSNFWQFQMKGLSDAAQIITFDLPGHGEFVWQGESLQDMAGEIFRILDFENVHHAHVVASSFGGLVALGMMSQKDQVFQSMSLIGSLPRFTSTEGFSAGLNSERIQKLSAQLEGDVGSVLDMFFRSLFTMAERNLEQYGVIKDMRAKAPLPQRQALQAVLKMLDQEDLSDVFNSLDIPMQFIFGDSDYICPMNVIDVLKQQKPDAVVHILKDVGHFPFLSHPEEVNQMIKGFLKL